MMDGEGCGRETGLVIWEPRNKYEARNFLMIPEDPNEEARNILTSHLQNWIRSWRWSNKAFLILSMLVVLTQATSHAADLWKAMCSNPSLHSSGQVGFVAVQQQDFNPAHSEQHGWHCPVVILPKSPLVVPYLSLQVSNPSYSSFDHPIV